MFIILGGTGQVGGATARALLRQGQAVTVVTRDAGRAADLTAAGAQVAEADIRDAEALRQVFRAGRRAFLLNPPADPSGDTDAEETATAAAMLAALDGSGLEKVVAASTYGARPGRACGDLTVLHGLEQGLAAQKIPWAVNRGAYYMSNWAGMLEPARESGVLTSFFPAGLELPMVAPEDLGVAAARRLMEPAGQGGLHHVEGPERYTPADVAAAMAEVLGRKVEVQAVPRADWEATFRQIGFSDSAATSYARMTATVVDGETERPAAPERGAVTLRDYVRTLADA